MASPRFWQAPPNTVGFQVDEVQRYVIPDVMRRKDDVFRPPGMRAPTTSPLAAQGLTETGVIDGASEILTQLTTPAPRPVVYQTGMNLTVAVPAGSAVPIVGGATLQVDQIIVDNLSTAANSVFFGFGSSVNAGNGLEVRAGLPLVFGVENSREQWELQRLLEMIAIALGQPVDVYRAPRVVLDATKWFLFATAATNVNVMLLNVPQLQ